MVLCKRHGSRQERQPSDLHLGERSEEALISIGVFVRKWEQYCRSLHNASLEFSGSKRMWSHDGIAIPMHRVNVLNRRTHAAVTLLIVRFEGKPVFGVQNVEPLFACK